MKNIWINEIKDKVGKTVELFGWVNVRRDHGKIIFIDLRDRSGICQLVFTPKDDKLYKIAETLRPEWVISVKGEVAERPKGMENPEIETGKVEMKVKEINVLSESETSPFPLDTSGHEIDEELRLKYRYLDLRRKRLKNNLIMRHRLIKFIRDYLNDRDFIEVETPILTKSTPEGARDYVVPSRLYPGKFYALPQSPQQYKQLLMVGGIEKYFQIAKCFRDEDTRGDRQPEFTQLDIEMSFIEREDVMELNEKLFIDLIKEVYPEKKVQENPFPVFSYKDVMEKYGTDRPDLRKDKNNANLLAFCWVTDFPFFEKDKSGKWTFTHNPFSAPISEHKDDLKNEKNIEKIIADQYDVVLNGLEIGGGSIRNNEKYLLDTVFRLIGVPDIEKSFGYIGHALNSGAPPHGGIAWGLDRLISILANEPNIREVIAFPKTGDARDPMMDSPSEIDKKQLKELGLEIKKK